MNQTPSIAPAPVHAPTTGSPDGPYAFRLDRGEAGLQTLLADWQALVARLPDADHLHRPEWAAAYARHLAGDIERMLWASVRQDGRLVAVLPIEQTGRRQLRLLTNEHLYLADVVSSADPLTLWPAFWRWLQHDAGLSWTRLDVGRLRDGGWLAQALAQVPSHVPPRHDFHSRIGGSAWLDVDRCYDALLRGASANHRSSLTRGAKKAEQMGGLRYESHATAKALAAALPHFVEVEASGWKGEQGGAVACRPEWLAFYRELTERLAGPDDGRDGEPAGCEIDLLWLGDRPVATIFWLRTGGTLALQKIAYREDLASIGPGKQILARALARACADPRLHRVSFITRCPWADGWRTEVTPVSGHLIYAEHARGHAMAVLRRLWQTAKAGVRVVHGAVGAVGALGGRLAGAPRPAAASPAPGAVDLPQAP